MPALEYSLPLTSRTVRNSGSGRRPRATGPDAGGPTRSPNQPAAEAGQPGARRRSVIRAEPVPAVELDGFRGELPHPRLRQPRQHRVERLLLADSGIEGLVAAEARRDPKRLAAQLTQPWEGLQQELLVRDRLADLERRVPRGQHREVVVVELVDRLGVVGLQLVLGDLVDPRADDLA